MNEEINAFKSTKQVLELIGLSHEEINAYFHLTGRGPVMVGEIALLIDVEEDKAKSIAKNLLLKGLVREIPGKTPFYMTLPPYAALLNQIKQFKDIVKNIQETTPKALQLKFQEIEEHSAKLGKLEEYRNYIQMMKTNLPNQMKTQFSRVESELDKVKKFQEIRAFILNLRTIVPEEIIKEFDVVESRLDKIKSEISTSFEKTFRIGALKTMAEKIVDRVVTEQFHSLIDYFQEKIIGTIQSTLDQVTNQLASISDAAGDMSIDLGNTLSDIESRLKETLEDLEQRISTVYEDVDRGIKELKEMFQKEIYKILEEDIMTNILNQLELSEETMTEFWERSKQASMLTFKDVWFVRSVEGMKAQINEAMTRVKMRVHIIAPRLEDIDLIALTKVKKHVNVRISTNFNWDDPIDQEKLAEILQINNFAIRHYSRENIWAINRDFEEVAICAVSKVDQEFEIAGMGSILEEHVKLFASVIEDVWIQSKKIDDSMLMYKSRPQQIQESKRDFKPQIKRPVSILNEITVQEKIEINPIQQVPKIPTKSTEERIIQQQPQESTKETTGKSSISNQLQEVIRNLTTKTAHDISLDLENIRNNIVEQMGYSSVLNQISIGIASLKTGPNILSPNEIDALIKKINFWKKKLHL
ncbi:MAG: helix-turn-helix domain-containing protein [Promethearchaeota archaeon]